MTIDLLKDLLIQTVKNPQDVARRIMAMNIPRNVVMLLFAVTCIVSGSIRSMVSLATIGPEAQIFTPFGAVLFCAFETVVAAGVIVFLGRLFGGTATFQNLFRLEIWLQLFQVVLSIASIVFWTFSPGLSAMLVWFSIVFSLWVLVNFTTVAHGFTSRGKVAVGMIFMVFGLAFVISILASSMGLLPEVAV